MNSMTGYGRGSATGSSLELVVEISSVNRKNLEVQVSAPKEWSGVDRLLTDLVRGAAGRGKVYLQLTPQAVSETDPLGLDDERIKAMLNRLRELAISQQVSFNLDSHLLFQIANSIRDTGEPEDWKPLEPLIREATESALERWQEMRAEEGAELLKDLLDRADRLKAMTAEIRDHGGQSVSNYREKLLERLRQAGLELDLEDERVLKEIALFADRCDISEELTRLDSHFTMLISTLKAEGLVGRKLDFICQEIYREFNTVGSKANNLEISRLIIECKNEWERLREQAANVE